MNGAVRSLRVAVVFATAFATRAYAQTRLQPIPIYSEYRADVIAGRGTAVQGGLGVVIPAGIYVRFTIDAAAGPVWHEGLTNTSGRVDAVARFLLDPFRANRIGLSFGGGLTVPYAEGDAHVRPELTAVIDVEGRMRRRWTPALQVGLGGGTRVGFVLRRSPRTWR